MLLNNGQWANRIMDHEGWAGRSRMMKADGEGSGVNSASPIVNLLAAVPTLQGTGTIAVPIYGDPHEQYPTLKSALACAVTLGAASLASTALAQSSMPMSSGSMQMKMTPQMEMMRHHETMAMMKKDKYAKCYGVNASFKNDCKSTGHSCAGFRRLRAKRLHPLRAVMRSVVPLYALSALYVVIGPIFALLSRLE